MARRPTARLPFSSDISAETADALAERLGHYAFRLFVRGVIHHGDGFTPDEPTSYVSPTQARLFTETLVALVVVLPTAEAIRVLQKSPKKTNAVLHITC